MRLSAPRATPDPCAMWVEVRSFREERQACRLARDRGTEWRARNARVTSATQREEPGDGQADNDDSRDPGHDIEETRVRVSANQFALVDKQEHEAQDRW